MTKIYFIRHGQSNVNVEALMGGPKSDKGLTGLGVSQAERLHDRLRATGEIQADVLLASPLPRAHQTAEIIALALGVPVNIEPDIEEIRPGDLVDELSFQQAVAKYGDPDFGNPDKPFFPGSETIREFVERVQRTLNRIAQEYAGKTVVLATHGGVIDNAMILLAGADRWSFPFPLPYYTLNTSLTLWEHKTVPVLNKTIWTLMKYNDAAHVLDIDSPERFNWTAMRR